MELKVVGFYLIFFSGDVSDSHFSGFVGKESNRKTKLSWTYEQNVWLAAFKKSYFYLLEKWPEFQREQCDRSDRIKV